VVALDETAPMRSGGRREAGVGLAAPDGGIRFFKISHARVMHLALSQ
jgi:hypothetical protein